LNPGKSTRLRKSSVKRRPPRIYLTDSAKKDLELLATKDRKRIGDRLKACESSGNPMGFAKPLINTTIGHFRFRIDPYRLPFDVVRGDIYILRVGDRKDIYR